MKIMNQKLYFLTAFAAVLTMAGCAKQSSLGQNSNSKKQLEAWMQLHYPKAGQTGLGCYILEDEEGTGPVLGDMYTYPYFSMKYTAKDLNGNISESTEATVAKQLGTYKSCNYYGPVTADRHTATTSSTYYSTETVYSIPAGLDDVISTMKVGGHRKAVIPGWLMTFSRHNTSSEYMDNESGTHMMYDIEITDAIYDLFKFQVDSIERYMDHNLVKVDSTINGLYYIQTAPPTDTTTYKSGDVVYVNYVGRLLNGQVFDTTIKDTAKIHGIYNPSTSYTSMGVKLAENYKENSMASSSDSKLIAGFSYCVSHMKKGEKGTVVFYSTLGYGESASGKIIPAFSPLRFDIEFLGNKESK